MRIDRYFSLFSLILSNLVMVCVGTIFFIFLLLEGWWDFGSVGSLFSSNLYNFGLYSPNIFSDTPPPSWGLSLHVYYITWDYPTGHWSFLILSLFCLFSQSFFFVLFWIISNALSSNPLHLLFSIKYAVN